MGSTTVRYLIQRMLPRQYILECTTPALVSDIVHSYISFHLHHYAYSTEGNFGKVFNLVNWQICGKSPNLKSANIFNYAVF